MTILLILLVLIYPVMPAPWTPEQPLTLPLRVEATGGADVLPIVRGDNQIASINIRPMDGQACWRVQLWDAAGQTYAVRSRACGTRFFLPFVEETTHGD